MDLTDRRSEHAARPLLTHLEGDEVNATAAPGYKQDY
jgi:hypothetical protein